MLPGAWNWDRSAWLAVKSICQPPDVAIKAEPQTLLTTIPCYPSFLKSSDLLRLSPDLPIAVSACHRIVRQPKSRIIDDSPHSLTWTTHWRSTIDPESGRPACPLEHPRDLVVTVSSRPSCQCRRRRRSWSSVPPISVSVLVVIVSVVASFFENRFGDLL